MGRDMVDGVLAEFVLGTRVIRRGRQSLRLDTGWGMISSVSRPIDETLSNAPSSLCHLSSYAA